MALASRVPNAVRLRVAEQAQRNRVYVVTATFPYRARIEAPLRVVALRDGGPGYLVLPRPLRGGPDVDEHAAKGHLAEGLLRGEPPQAGARGHQDLVDGAGPKRPDRHHAAAPSVSRLTTPPGVRS